MKFRRCAALAALAVCLAAPLPEWTTPAAAQTPFKIGVVSRTIFYLPAWTAQAQGFFKDAGIAASIEVYDGSDKISEDLRSGAIQFGITSIESIVADAYKGGTLRLIAGTAQKPPHYIIAQPAIKALADLKGTTIGVVSMNEGMTFFVADIAKAGGFGLGDVTVRAVGGSPTRARLLKEKKIDAGLQPYPLSYEAEADGFSNLGPIADLVPDYQFTSVVVEDGFAKANRATVVAFLKALARGTQYMFANPDASAALGAKELRTSEAFARRALEDTARMNVMARDLAITDQSLARVFENVKTAQLVPAGAAYDRGVFVDESYLKEAAR